MARTETVLRVFVSSPADVSEEVTSVAAAITELNSILPRTLGIRFELVTWRSDAVPGIGTDPQAVINRAIGDDYDIFVGVLWARFGTSTPRAGSGTEEEFERAYSRYQRDPDSVRIMIYFKRASVEIDALDPVQLQNVNSFRSKLGERGALYWDFSTREQLEGYIRLHLSRQASEWANSAERPELQRSRTVAAATGEEPIEEGLIDIAESGTESFQIATEAMQRVTRLQEEMTARTSERIAQMQALQSTDSENKPRLLKHILNLASVDLEQFAKGLTNETSVISTNVMAGLDALSRSLTYTECYSEQNLPGLLNLGALLPQFIRNFENHRNAMLDLREAIRGLPRFTTDFNRAKRDAVIAIDNYDRNTTGAIPLLDELRRNYETLMNRLSPPQ